MSSTNVIKDNFVVLEGAFGEARINCTKPGIDLLFLRQPNGALSEKSLCAMYPSEFPGWALGGQSYFCDTDGVLYESRRSTGHELKASSQERVEFQNIYPTAETGAQAPIRESWTLEVDADGALVWKIERLCDCRFSVSDYGGPAFFFNIRANTEPTGSGQKKVNPAGNGVALNWWVATDQLQPEKRAGVDTKWQRFFPEYNCAALKDRDGWAVFKLYTSLPNHSDLKVESLSGHLYRKAWYNAFTEIGVAHSQKLTYDFKENESTSIGMRMNTIGQFETGQQLMIETPDHQMEQNLKSYFSGLANAACLCDNVNHTLGNQCDGFQFAGNTVMHGLSLLASCPCEKPLSAHPVTYPEAFRENLRRNLNSVSEDGQVTFGFCHGGKEGPGIPLMNLIGMECALLYTGDTSLISKYAETIQRMLDYLNGWIKDGLFIIEKDRIMEEGGYPNWYYDGVPVSGPTLYHNVFYYRALSAAATMYKALGRKDKAAELLQRRNELKKLINKVLWSEETFEGKYPGYYDWIPPDGRKRAYFFSIAQYAAVVFGIADSEQASKILCTADRRIKVLMQDYHYTREATLDTLWPLAEEDFTSHRFRGVNGDSFGTYMNGGMLLTVTFYEVVARCRAGDADGAYQLLKNFSLHAGRTNWFEGDSAFSIDAKPWGWGGEPFLADQLLTAAAVVHGFFGVQYSWEDISFDPALPLGWESIKARLRFKGQDYEVFARRDGAEKRKL